MWPLDRGTGDELGREQHPSRVAGLVYLDAGYPYAFDNGREPTMKEFSGISAGSTSTTR